MIDGRHGQWAEGQFSILYLYFNQPVPLTIKDIKVLFRNVYKEVIMLILVLLFHSKMQLAHIKKKPTGRTEIAPISNTHLVYYILLAITNYWTVEPML